MNMTSGNDMLRKLASGVRPAGAPGVLGRAGPANAGFPELLEAAAGGRIASGRPVTPEKGLSLTDEQQAGLAEAADRAEAAGSSRVLVQLGGSWFRVDVGARQVSAAEGPRPGEVVTGVDAVIREPARPSGPAAPGGADLLRKLAGRAR